MIVLHARTNPKQGPYNTFQNPANVHLNSLASSLHFLNNNTLGKKENPMGISTHTSASVLSQPNALLDQRSSLKTSQMNIQCLQETSTSNRKLHSKEHLIATVNPANFAVKRLTYGKHNPYFQVVRVHPYSTYSQSITDRLGFALSIKRQQRRPSWEIHKTQPTDTPVTNPSTIQPSRIDSPQYQYRGTYLGKIENPVRAVRAHLQSTLHRQYSYNSHLLP